MRKISKLSQPADWMEKFIEKQSQGIGQGIADTFNGLAGGFKEGKMAKMREYAERIMNGEPKDQVLQGLGPSVVQMVEQELSKLQGGQQPQPQQQPQTQQPQYSISGSERWAESTGNPSIITYIDKVNGWIASKQTQGLNPILQMILNAMNGDNGAYQQLVEKAGGQATKA